MASPPCAPRQNLREIDLAELDRWENEGGAPGHAYLSPRLMALKRQHRRMHALIDMEEKRPNACTIELKRLKREKLYLKDEIDTLARLRS
jgi:hypothetical protein